MLIVVEGPDCAGKTTLIEEIQKLITQRYQHDSVEVIHRGPPTMHPLEEYETPLFDYRPGSGKHLILDRWHVGEWIYPHFLGRETLADNANWRHIEMFLQSRGAILVHVTAHSTVIAECLETRGDDLIKPDQAAAIVQAYHAQLANSRLPITVSITRDKTWLAAQRIVGKAKLHEMAYEPVNRYVTYIGARRPNLLIFGDERHQVDQRDPRSPVFMPYRSTSGHYLLSQTTSLFRNAGLANACDVDDPIALWKDIGEPQVIALGRNAWGCVKDRIPNVIGIPHPQFVRRFHNRAGAEWMEAIRYGIIHSEDMIAWRPL
jgi:hypothetical protein